MHGQGLDDRKGWRLLLWKKNKTGRDYWQQIYLDKICFSEYSESPRGQINKRATLCKHFLALRRTSSAILDDRAPDEGVEAESPQRIKLSKVSFETQSNLREMFATTICMALLMKLIWVGLFWLDTLSGLETPSAAPRCLLCMVHLPCSKDLQMEPKSTRHSTSVSTQASRAARKCLGGSGVEGKQEMQYMPCFQILRRLLPRGRDSLWAHLYFSYFSNCSLYRPMGGSQIQQTQHRYGFSLQLPRHLTPGRAGCCVCHTAGGTGAASKWIHNPLHKLQAWKWL